MKTLVTNDEIEKVGESLIKRYVEEKNPDSRCIDIEGFIQDVLHLPIVYAFIAEKEMDKIGFVSDGVYPLKIRENGEVTERVFPKGTVVIDKYLLREENSSQRRFTLSHEGSHIIFERMCPTIPGPCFNRFFDNERSYNLRELRERFNLCEIQTDRLAAVLLMPRFLVERIMSEYKLDTALPVYAGSILRRKDKLTVQKMADTMGVSFSALINRLRELGMVEHHSMEEYLASEMNFGGDDEPTNAGQGL